MNYKRLGKNVLFPQWSRQKMLCKIPPMDKKKAPLNPFLVIRDNLETNGR